MRSAELHPQQQQINSPSSHLGGHEAGGRSGRRQRRVVAARVGNRVNRGAALAV